MTEIKLKKAVEIIDKLEADFDYKCKKRKCTGCPFKDTRCELQDYVEYIINEGTSQF